MWPILLALLLVFVAIVLLPRFGHMQPYALGYFPTGAALLLVIVLVILMLAGKL